MKYILPIIFIVLISAQAQQPCRIRGPRLTSNVRNELPITPINDLPKEWLWNDINGKDFLTITKN